jgi:Cysteine-rich secretory protein family
MAYVFKRSLAAAAITLSLGAAASAQSNVAPRQMPSRILEAHNAVRMQAGVPPLEWDAALGNAAAGYAFELALTNSFHHSAPSSRHGTGENLWMGTRGAFSYEAMVERWKSERRFFIPGVFPSVSRSGNWEDVGHYTQMVWPTTTHVGCAIASNATSDFLVCRYSPPGNVEGRPVPYLASITKSLTRVRY